MVKTAQLNEKDVVVEIGPGKGALTKKILEQVGILIAIEMDSELVTYLQEKFTAEIAQGKLIIVSGDALDLSGFSNQLSVALRTMETDRWKLVANIPYYITGAILKTYLTAEHQPSEMVLLMQKEVAERIVKRDGKESILGLSVEIFGNASFIKKVPPSAFSPSPAVDSAIVHIIDISRKRLPKEQEEKFFTLIKLGFAHKRKTLKKNLSEKYSPENIISAFQKCTIPEKTRSEELTIHTWLCLMKNL